MAFISVADELTKRTVTSVENKFITKYMPELEPVSVKVYLFALYLYQNGQSSYSLADLAQKLKLSEEQAQSCFEYLEEIELVAITSRSPFEIKILDCENYSGKPKKLHPEKYEGLYEEIQNIVSGRMISQDEFREYLLFLEEYSFERNALIMIVNYCATLKGNDISAPYIKKVLKNFAAEGIVSALQVEDKLSSFTGATAALIKIFSACGIKRSPAVEDGDYYKKWQSLGFTDEAIIAATKFFKCKNLDKLDGAIEELYKSKKFDVKEIDDYRKNKDNLYDNAYSIAKALGVYISDATAYVENYINSWVAFGFSGEALKKIATYCFLCGRNSFDLMDGFVGELYKNAFVDDSSVDELLKKLAEDDAFIKTLLSSCGLTRKIIPYDRQALARWRDWGFNDAMIQKAAELSATKNNPMASVNYLLSTWKNAGIYTVEQIPSGGTAKANSKRSVTDGWMHTISVLNGIDKD